MKRLATLVLILSCVLVLIGCTNEQGGLVKEAIMQRTFSPNNTTNTIAVNDNKMLYQTIDMGSSTFFVYDLEDGKESEIATLSNYVMDSGSAVIIGDTVYEYITVVNQEGQKQNELFAINCSDMTMESISIDIKSAPIISLYRISSGILALKTTDSGTHFELINVNTKTTNIVLEAPEGETFVTASIYDDHLFVFAYSGNSDNGYSYFIREYDTEEYAGIATVSLDNIEPYISQTRIAEMGFFGEYLFLNNYSNIGLIASVNEDGTVSSLYEIQNAAYLSSNTGSGKEIFYVRQSNTYYVFNVDKGDLQHRELNFGKKLTIRSMFFDGENIIVKTKENKENKSNTYREEIYVFDQKALLNSGSVN